MNTIKTKYIFDIFSGATPKSSILSFWDGNIVWVTPADYKSEDKYINDSEKHITEDGYNSCATNLVPKGSIVVAKRAPIGTVAIANLPLCTNQGCLSCVPHKNINSTFYYYVLFAWNQHMDKLGQGTTFMEIPFKVFRNMKVPLYPVQQQQQIVAYLDAKCDAIDGAIAHKRSVIEKLKEYRTAVITKAVTKGLNPDVKMKDSGVKWFTTIPSHWLVKRLKFVFDNFDYQRKPVDASNRSQKGHILYDYYGASGVIDKIDDYTCEGRKMLIGEDGANLVLRNLPLIYIADGKYWVNNHAHIINTKAGYDFYYFAYQLEAIDYAEFITGMAQPKLSQKNLNKVSLIVPPYDEQKQISIYLDAKCSKIDSAIQQQEQAIAKLEEYRKSIIYYAVTGKIDCGKAV